VAVEGGGEVEHEGPVEAEGHGDEADGEVARGLRGGEEGD
jgi:hypothetical protein